MIPRLPLRALLLVFASVLLHIPFLAAQPAPGPPAAPAEPAPGPLAAPAEPVPGSPAAPTAEAASEGVITAEAPIVAGNAFTAKERALNDAFRQAVERAFAGLLAEAGIAETAVPPGLVRLRASFTGNPRRFIRTHRVLEQGEVAGHFRVQIDAEVNEGLLRREIDRARGTTSPTPGKVAPGSLLLAGPAPAEAVLAVAKVLAGAGFRADPSTVGEVDEGRARELASRSGASAAVLVAGTVTAEGPVRGTDRIAARCQLQARVVPAGGGSPVSPRTVEDRAFASTEDAARAGCWTRAAAQAGREIAGVMGGLSPAAPGARFVRLELDLVEPAALGQVLQGLRKIGSVSSTEVRQISVGRAELRVVTRLAGDALGAALGRELARTLTISVAEASPDRVAVRARLRGPEVPAAQP